MLNSCMLSKFACFFVICGFFFFFSRIPSECQTIWIQIKPSIFFCLIWVQTVCKGYQQTTKVATKRGKSQNKEVFALSHLTMSDFSPLTQKFFLRIFGLWDVYVCLCVCVCGGGGGGGGGGGICISLFGHILFLLTPYQNFLQNKNSFLTSRPKIKISM